LFGDESGAYRMHPILRDFLLKKLKQADPEAFAGLHAKAALWYRSQGLPAQAVPHYLSAMRYGDAFDLIEMQLGSFASKNEYETVRFWIEQLPESYQRKSVKIAAFYSMYTPRAGASIVPPMALSCPGTASARSKGESACRTARGSALWHVSAA
jgi:LuxR family maltose regulon positive regulatory protein